MRKPFPKRAPGNEADPQFFASRQHFRFRIARPKGVFALDGSDRLDRVGTTYGLRACLGKAEVLDLAFRNQVLYRPATSSIGTAGSTRC